MDKTTTQLQFQARNNSGEDKFEKIQDSTIYPKESDGYLLNLNYLVS